MTIKDLYLSITGEAPRDHWSDKQLIEKIHEEIGELQEQIDRIELEIDAHDDLQDQVDELEQELKDARVNVPLIEDVLYELCIPNPFTSAQIIQINNQLQLVAEIE